MDKMNEKKIDFEMSHSIGFWRFSCQISLIVFGYGHNTYKASVRKRK